jgi:hypothetical protein
MFNVTIIKLRDIIKFIIVSILIYVLIKFMINNVTIKNILNKPISINTSDFVQFSINCESNLIKNISNQENFAEQTEDIEEDFDTLALKSILKIGTSVFASEENDGQDNEIKSTAETEEQASETTNQDDLQETTTDLTTEVVTANPIAENYNKEYNGIKIKNETSFELTDDILNTESLDIDTNNIIIFHTHTCESYTPSENSNYEASRKL